MRWSTTPVTGIRACPEAGRRSSHVAVVPGDVGGFLQVAHLRVALVAGAEARSGAVVPAMGVGDWLGVGVGVGVRRGGPRFHGVGRGGAPGDARRWVDRPSPAAVRRSAATSARGSRVRAMHEQRRDGGQTCMRALPGKVEVPDTVTPGTAFRLHVVRRARLRDKL